MTNPVTSTQVRNSFWVSGSTRELTYYNSLTRTLPEVPINISSSAKSFQIRVTPVSPSSELQFKRINGLPITATSPIVLGPQSESVIIASINPTGYDNLTVPSVKTFNIAFNLIALQTASLPSQQSDDTDNTQKLENGSTCTANNQCLSEYCNLFVSAGVGLGICQEAPELKGEGEPCTANTECESGTCVGSDPTRLNSGRCSP
jgi:hypothetical protein